MMSRHRVKSLAGSLLAVLAAATCLWPSGEVAAAGADDAAAKASSGPRATTGRRTPRNPQGGAAATQQDAGKAGLSTSPSLGDPLSPALPDPLAPIAPLPPAASTLPDNKPRHTLANCMKLWDAATHMSKPEWRTTCLRSLKEADASAKAAEKERTKKEPRKKHSRRGKSS